MPSMKVEGDSDGDGDMSGGDTERSNGSSRGPDRDSSAEEADEPDSDDSSEMDESECERRRNECLDNLANLERQFTVLREQLYCERVKQVDHQLAEVRGGRSQEYLGPLRRLQENMRIRIEVAGILKTMRYENIKHKYEAEELAAQQHFKRYFRIRCTLPLRAASRAVSLKRTGRCRTTNKMANIGWTNDKVLKFIRMYREKRILWDPNNGDYYNKNLKHEAWKDISLRMGCDLLELRRKMDYLMAGLRREKMKLTKARQSGIGRTESTWFAYDPLKFLLGRTKSKEMIRKIRMQFARKYDIESEEQPAQSDNQEEDANQTSEEHNITVDAVATQPLTEHDDSHNVTMNTTYNYNPPEIPIYPVVAPTPTPTPTARSVNDECQMFANYLACKLRSYTKKTRNTVQYQINHILYIADDGQFEAPVKAMTTQSVQLVNLPRKVVAAPFANLANCSPVMVNGEDVCEIDIKEES